MAIGRRAHGGAVLRDQSPCGSTSPVAELTARRELVSSLRLLFVVERPTQFEAPFFRFATEHSSPDHSFSVLFLTADPGENVDDPELGRRIDWGFDRLAGYDWSVLPGGLSPAERLDLLRKRLDGQDLVIVNGYTWPIHREIASLVRELGGATALRLDSTGFGESSWRRLAKKWLLVPALRRRFDYFLPVGSAASEYLESLGVPATRIGRFPYAVDHDRFRGAREVTASERARLRSSFDLPADTPSRPVVLVVSKLAERETPWDVVEAGDLAADLLVVGDGPQRTRFATAVQNTWGDRARFAGYVPYDRLGEAYAVSDVFLHAPREERWGVSIAEALAAGLRVVAHDEVGAARDLVIPGENGEIYPARPAHAIDRGTRPSLSRAALERALALDPASARATSDRILAEWGYEATWRDLLTAAAAADRRRDEAP